MEAILTDRHFNKIYGLFSLFNLILSIFLINFFQGGNSVFPPLFSVFPPFFKVFKPFSVFQKGGKTLNKGVKTVDSYKSMYFTIN